MQIRLQLLWRLEVNGLEAQGAGGKDVVLAVVDEQAVSGGAADALEQQVEDSLVRLDQPHLARDDDILKNVEDGVQGAHLGHGMFLSQQSVGGHESVLSLIFDPAGRFFGFTMFEKATGGLSSDYRIRFGFGLKDAGYTP